jgi:hypothetical protein
MQDEEEMGLLKDLNCLRSDGQAGTGIISKGHHDGGGQQVDGGQQGPCGSPQKHAAAAAETSGFLHQLNNVPDTEDAATFVPAREHAWDGASKQPGGQAESSPQPQPERIGKLLRISDRETHVAAPDAGFRATANSLASAPGRKLPGSFKRLRRLGDGPDGGGRLGWEHGEAGASKAKRGSRALEDWSGGDDDEDEAKVWRYSLTC